MTATRTAMARVWRNACDLYSSTSNGADACDCEHLRLFCHCWRCAHGQTWALVFPRVIFHRINDNLLQKQRRRNINKWKYETLEWLRSQWSAPLLCLVGGHQMRRIFPFDAREPCARVCVCVSVLFEFAKQSAVSIAITIVPPNHIETKIVRRVERELFEHKSHATRLPSPNLFLYNFWPFDRRPWRTCTTIDGPTEITNRKFTTKKRALNISHHFHPLAIGRWLLDGSYVCVCGLARAYVLTTNSIREMERSCTLGSSWIKMVNAGATMKKNPQNVF